MNFLKSIAILTLAFTSVSVFAEGGSHVGNGGGTIVCRNADKTIQSTELLDYYEARTLRNLQIVTDQFPGDYKAKAQALINRFATNSQFRQTLYTRWLKQFDSESMILNGVQFNNIPDAMEIGVPTGCAFEQAAVQIVPSLPGDKRYYLQGEIWSAMSEAQKAGLLLHEFAFREALSYGHTNSVNTRYFVGLFSSRGFEAMSFKDFLKTLNTIRYELNDFPVPDVNLISIFDPKELFRLNADSEDTPDLITLKGRMIANVGECLNEGCTGWIKKASAFADFPSFQFCGYRNFIDGSGNEFGTVRLPLERYENVGCTIKGEISWNQYDHKSVLSLSADLYGRDGKQTAGEPLEFKQDQNRNRARVLSFRDGKLAYLEAQIFQNSILLANSRVNTLGCEYRIEFQDDGVRLNNLSAAMPRDPSACDYRVSFKSFEIVPNPTNNVIEFDESGNYSLGSIQKIIFSFNDSDSNSFGCNQNVSPCIRALKLKDGKPIQIQSDRVLTLNLMTASSCSIQPGIFDLQSTNVPAELTLAAECKLLDDQGQQEDLKTGTVIHLDSSGRVITHL